MRAKRYIAILILFVSFQAAFAQTWDKGLWTHLKYEVAHNNEHKKIIKQHLKDIKKPQTQEQRIWYFMTESTLASSVGGLNAVGILSDAKEGIEPYLGNPQTPNEFMACAVLSYIYSKVPGWPLGFGSKKTSKKWLKKSLSKSNQPDVAFYIAQTYHNLGNNKLAKQYAVQSLNGFKAHKSAYSEGKIQEIQNFSFFQ